MACDRYNFNKSFEHVQNKHVGTGHSDITKFEWAVNQHRDSISSFVGHADMLAYFSLAQNESIGRVRYQLLEVVTRYYCYLQWKKILFYRFLSRVENAAALWTSARQGDR